MIYLITDGVYTKIGKTNNPLNRIKSLQTSNSNKLLFQYVFDVPDKIEKQLHGLFKEYKTDSNNEWFNLSNIDIFKRMKSLNNIKLIDKEKAKFEADKLNNNRIFNKIEFKEKIKKVSNYTISETKANIKELIKDVKEHLEKKKNIRISYEPLMKKYNFSRKEISFFMKSCKLSKKIFEHNSKI